MLHAFKTILIAASLALLASHSASAHIGYGGRNFGTYDGTVTSGITITGQTVSSNFGWADATDEDFGDSHRIRFFRFTLTNTAIVTISVSGATGFLPAFSLYSGLAHIAVAPAEGDHDAATISVSYLNSLGGVPREGSLVALGNWKIGSVSFADLSSFTYIGHAADGTPANYGSASGINGDGLADNYVTGTFANLPAGDYSVSIGGANYSTQGPITLGLNSTNGSAYTSYGITTSINVVPEPSTVALLGLSSLGLLMLRRRRM